MDDHENSLLWYLVAVDTPNYELIDDDDEVVDAVVAIMDDGSSHRYRLDVGPRRLVPRERYDGDARIRRHYFGANPIYTPSSSVEGFR
ncbi:hypothetical protein U9M48_039108 [Paspalum notatum var. saurae]|uniref:Uncharacterized protein n=1 Tax=Paspalum notatum var. saurae TaxID=547442 RepID=A0AAQ3UPK5_PASNO